MLPKLTATSSTQINEPIGSTNFLDTTIESDNYHCPSCGQAPSDQDYEVNDELYPKCFNGRKGTNLEGDYWDWDEVHCCENCATLFRFKNGI